MPLDDGVPKPAMSGKLPEMLSRSVRMVVPVRIGVFGVLGDAGADEAHWEKLKRGLGVGDAGLGCKWTSVPVMILTFESTCRATTLLAICTMRFFLRRSLSRSLRCLQHIMATPAPTMPSPTITTMLLKGLSEFCSFLAAPSKTALPGVDGGKGGKYRGAGDGGGGGL